MPTHNDLLRQVQDLAVSAPDARVLMQRIADHVHSVMSRYNSISFRLVDETDPGLLVLGPYTGSFSPHPRVSLGQGLCGAAASEGKTIVVDDVSQDARYLSGSSMVKSEIVVPIFVRGKLVAEIDIQSYFAGTFSDARDRSFVEACGAVVAKFMSTHGE
ncbi:MAG: GAF domain-containing protein [Acidobacteriia bacterium]|nr:GAF domain-containing protein [Terriglobia bacterium]